MKQIEEYLLKNYVVVHLIKKNMQLLKKKLHQNVKDLQNVFIVDQQMDLLKKLEQD